ncbi:hypothetical protein [Sciscionella marina]|nr:hypothetical protein [Sciscionella marina]
MAFALVENDPGYVETGGFTPDFLFHSGVPATTRRGNPGGNSTRELG